jgi:hypothetical protein
MTTYLEVWTPENTGKTGLAKKALVVLKKCWYFVLAGLRIPPARWNTVLPGKYPSQDCLETAHID